MDRVEDRGSGGGDAGPCGMATKGWRCGSLRDDKKGSASSGLFAPEGGEVGDVDEFAEGGGSSGIEPGQG